MLWLKRFAVILVGLVLLAGGLFFGASQYLLDHTVDLELPAIRARTDAASLAEGARLARFEGCRVCHGERGQGRLLVDEPGVARVVAPALARVAGQASDEQLARAIRNGVSIHAKPLYIMPTDGLNRLSDDDVARLIGWIRSLEPTLDDRLEAKRVGPMGRLGILLGKYRSSVDRAGGQPRTRPADIGRYLVETSCAQCHALDRDRPTGRDSLIAPALARVAAAYDPAAFRTLLRTGKAAGGRELPMMSESSRLGLAALTDGEIAAIQAYLRRRAYRSVQG